MSPVVRTHLGRRSEGTRRPEDSLEVCAPAEVVYGTPGESELQVDDDVAGGIKKDTGPDLGIDEAEEEEWARTLALARKPLDLD